MRTLVDRKHLYVTWAGHARTDRNFHIRRNRRACNFYFHLRRLEVVAWYR